jgi:hypothetical protein
VSWRRLIGLLAWLAFAVVAVVLAVRAPEPAQKPPDARNGQVFIQDNLWTTRRWQYAVWVAPDGTPYAGRRSNEGGRWRTVDLATLPGNPFATPTADDEHNVYVIGVDAKGAAHVAGNMHNDKLRYANADAALERWAQAPRPSPSASMTYPAFAGLPDGTLMFWRRDGISGQGSVALDVLAPGASTWKKRGVILDGRPSRESPYLHHIAVDHRTGAIHLLFMWRAGAGAATNSDVGYARSDDAGRTWQTTGGSDLELPITHATAETVIDTAPTGSGLLNQAGLTVDAAGRPHGVVVFDRGAGQRALEHLWLTAGGRWESESVETGGIEGRPQLAGTPDGRVWLLAARGGSVVAIDVSIGRARLGERTIARVPQGWEVSYDSQALARTGRIQMLIPRGERPHVVEARLDSG